MKTETTPQAIDTVLDAFARGDMDTLMRHIHDQIDFRIDHYNDDADIAWQSTHDKAGLITVLQRLATEIFPQGTRMSGVQTTAMGDGWAITTLNQHFHYGVLNQQVHAHSWILSHSQEGWVDYFRETVTSIEPVVA